MPSRAASACCDSPCSGRSRRTVRPISARAMLYCLYEIYKAATVKTATRFALLDSNIGLYFGARNVNY